MIPNRRQFVASLAGAPLLLQSPSPRNAPQSRALPLQSSDPMLLHFEREARLIYKGARDGQVTPAACARFEALLRTQAVYLGSIGIDDVVKEAARANKQRLIDVTVSGEHREHMRQALRKRYPEFTPSNRPVIEPTVAQITAVADFIEANGISQHFDRMADSVAALSRKQSGVVQVQSLSDWWNSYCAWQESMNELDQALMMIYCSLGFILMLLGWELMCALWGLESGIVDLWTWLVC